MDRLEIVVATLVGLYFTWVVVSALRAGTIRYRVRQHSRATEPKTYWLTVAWFGLLALSGIGYALMSATGDWPV